MKNVHCLVMIGALGAGACHGRPGGVHTSQAVDVSQPPSVLPTSQGPIQIAAGVTVTPEAEYSASGLVGISSSQAWGEFSLAYGPGVEKIDPTKVTVAELASRGQGMVLIVNASSDANIVTAIRNLEKGQRVRVSGWRSTMAKGGQTMGPVIKTTGADTVVVYPTELQIDDRLYTPTALPAGAQ